VTPHKRAGLVGLVALFFIASVYDAQQYKWERDELRRMLDESYDMNWRLMQDCPSVAPSGSLAGEGVRLEKPSCPESGWFLVDGRLEGRDCEGKVTVVFGPGDVGVGRVPAMPVLRPAEP